MSKHKNETPKAATASNTTFVDKDSELWKCVYDAASVALTAFKNAQSIVTHSLTRLETFTEQFLNAISTIYFISRPEDFLADVVTHVRTRRFLGCDDTPYFAIVFDYVAHELHGQRATLLDKAEKKKLEPKPVVAVASAVSAEAVRSTQSEEPLIVTPALAAFMSYNGQHIPFTCNYRTFLHRETSGSTVHDPPRSSVFSSSLPASSAKQKRTARGGTGRQAKRGRYSQEQPNYTSSTAYNSFKEAFFRNRRRRPSLDVYTPQMRAYILQVSGDQFLQPTHVNQNPTGVWIDNLDSPYRQVRPLCILPNTWYEDSVRYKEMAMSDYNLVLRQLDASIPRNKRFYNLLVSDMGLKSRRTLLLQNGHISIDYPYHWQHAVNALYNIPNTNCTLKSFVICVGLEFCARYSDAAYAFTELNEFYNSFFKFYHDKYYADKEISKPCSSKDTVISVVPPKIIILTVPLIKDGVLYPYDFIRTMNRRIRGIALSKKCKYPVHFYDWDAETRDIQNFTRSNFTERFKRLYLELDQHSFFETTKYSFSSGQMA